MMPRSFLIFLICFNCFKTALTIYVETLIFEVTFKMYDSSKIATFTSSEEQTLPEL